MYEEAVIYYCVHHENLVKQYLYSNFQDFVTALEGNVKI